MRTKTILTIIGLVTSQSLFFSCSEDNSGIQPEGSNAGTLPNITNVTASTSTSVINQSYFANPDVYKDAINFMKSYIEAQGPGYVLTQTDLNMFYDKAQIPVDERLALDRVNEIAAQTTNAMQLPFDDVVQQLNASDGAKSLILDIHNNGAFADLDTNLTYKNLSDQEKSLVTNLNDYKSMWEQGGVSQLMMSPGEAGGTIGGIIGFGIGFCCPPAGPIVGLIVGAFFGVLIGESK